MSAPYGGLTEKYIEPLLYTKSNHWAYENEVRTIAPLDEKDPESEHFFCCFQSNMTLKEVILGARCEQDVQELLDLLANYRPKVAVLSTKVCSRTFRILLSECLA